MEYPINDIQVIVLMTAIIMVLHLHVTSSLEYKSLSFLKLQRSGFSLPIYEKTHLLHVSTFGAVGDAIHDDTQAFKDAWEVACSLSWRSTIIVPEGYTYLLQPTEFPGCHTEVTLRILGAIIAPKDPEVWVDMNPRKWLYFHAVDHLTLEGGGTINGMGEQWWAQSCKTNSTIPCHHAPTAITFHRCKNLIMRDINIIDSPQMHVSFTNCNSVVVSDVTLTAPAESPNTDGIHISASSDVLIKDSKIRTGDDCVSIVSNSSRVVISNLACGPGHGISIGSLGRWNELSEVEDVIVDGAYLSNTQNGVRIKTWQGGAGFVEKVMFKNIWMENVSHPIIVDQYYCDAPEPCENQTSAVKIRQVSFMGIKGTSASEEVITFACSDNTPCQELLLEDIQLITYTGGATSFCWNAQGSSSGIVYPPPCFSTNESMIEQKTSSASHYSS